MNCQNILIHNIAQTIRQRKAISKTQLLLSSSEDNIYCNYGNFKDIFGNFAPEIIRGNLTQNNKDITYTFNPIDAGNYMSGNYNIIIPVSESDFTTLDYFGNLDFEKLNRYEVIDLFFNQKMDYFINLYNYTEYLHKLDPYFNSCVIKPGNYRIYVLSNNSQDRLIRKTDMTFTL